ncbi:MAG: adenylate kinase [Oscillospiraceae bacterium]|nr:adenylate kinase [Oscillospiraceae bacterium]
MIILITGASHTGKTLLAQKLLEIYHIPYLSLDHLKMGLIRSGKTDLTPYDDEELTGYLWGIVKEMIKTAIENQQNLIVEGCYIPFEWQQSFDAAYRKEIRYVCLVMSEAYIRSYFDEIIRYENVIEKRLPDPEITEKMLIRENLDVQRRCRRSGLDYILIDQAYDIDAIAGTIIN